MFFIRVSGKLPDHTGKFKKIIIKKFGRKKKKKKKKQKFYSRASWDYFYIILKILHCLKTTYKERDSIPVIKH